MRLLLQLKNEASCGAATEDGGDPFADAGAVVDDWQGLAARWGVSQAEARRRAYRIAVAVADAADSIPPAKETVLLTREEVEAQLEKERGAGKKKAEKKAEGK